MRLPNTGCVNCGRRYMSISCLEMLHKRAEAKHDIECWMPMGYLVIGDEVEI